MKNKDFAKRLAQVNDDDFNFIDAFVLLLYRAYANDNSKYIHDMFRLLSWCNQKEFKDFKDYPHYFEEIDPNSYEWDIWLLNHGFVIKAYDDSCVDFIGHNVIMHREEEQDRIYWAISYEDGSIEFDLNPVVLLLKNFTQEDIDAWKKQTMEYFKVVGAENRKKCKTKLIK